MSKFAAAKPRDKRAIAFNKNPNYIPQILAKVTKFEVKNSEINTQNSDFGAVAAGGVVYFTSTRDGGKKYGWNDQPFLDIYMHFFQTNELIDATKYATIPAEIGKLEYEFQKGDGYMQMQNLWTALGAKYQPSIIYKIRIITIASDEIEGFETKVNTISNTANPKSW